MQNVRDLIKQETEYNDKAIELLMGKLDDKNMQEYAEVAAKLNKIRHEIKTSPFVLFNATTRLQ